MTTSVAMPNVVPPPNTLDLLKKQFAVYERDAVVDWNFNPAPTVTDEIPRMAEQGIAAFKIFMVVEVAVLVIALAIALIRNNRSPGFFPVRLLATVWVDVFRGVPTILLVYLIGFGIPALELEGLPTEPVVLGGIALTLSYSGYVSEVYRAGIDSVHTSQRAGALALGLTGRQALRFVILPQAVRRVVPPLLNDFISLQKDVALVSILGPLEAFRVAQIDASSNFEYTPLVAAAVLYLCVTIPLARIVDRMQRR